MPIAGDLDSRSGCTAGRKLTVFVSPSEAQRVTAGIPHLKKQRQQRRPRSLSVRAKWLRLGCPLEAVTGRTLRGLGGISCPGPVASHVVSTWHSHMLESPRMRSVVWRGPRWPISADCAPKSLSLNPHELPRCLPLAEQWVRQGDSVPALLSCTSRRAVLRAAVFCQPRQNLRGSCPCGYKPA